ncbi:MAG: alpha,alpha-trehalase TreF [Bacteroidetes Order II. Incertae sedis bacterium]|nr:alpha,alpha-trehalase TreF [Bacteroidetes Order II. bacterium]
MRSRFILLLVMLMAFSACNPVNTREYNFKQIKLNPSPDVWYGVLFEAVQMARIFPDGKTFVDCTPKSDPKEIVARYLTEKEQLGFDLKTFVTTHFDLPPTFASGFRSDTTQAVQQHISELWPVLTRQPDEAAPFSSLIPLPRPYVVPGGRFGEVYYWDSYFTILGLKADEKWDIIQDMTDNFAFLIQTVGHIPNGNRTYYTTRSQPPFFSLIVGILAEGKGLEVYEQYLPELEKEYTFWMAGADRLSESNHAYRRVVRTPDGNILNRYWDDSVKPRPESYREDVVLAQRIPQRIPSQVYRDIRAAAESGWDFSSRWLRDGKSLASIHTTEIIPVDLNALLYQLEQTLSRAHTRSGNAEKAAFYRTKAEARKSALLKLTWNETEAYFYDYDFVAGRQTTQVTLAATFPLFLKMATNEQAAGVAKKIEQELLHTGGLSTTGTRSGQQWDAPNGWAPHQWTAYVGFKNYGLKKLAREIRNRWIALNNRVYRTTGKMVEKYNVMEADLAAGGGEYPLQDGFGWSNGVLRAFLAD